MQMAAGSCYFDLIRFRQNRVEFVHHRDSERLEVRNGKEEPASSICAMHTVSVD